MKKQNGQKAFMAATIAWLSEALLKLNSSLNTASFINELRYLNRLGIQVKIASFRKWYSKEKQQIKIKVSMAFGDDIRKTEEITYLIFFNNEGHFSITDERGRCLSATYCRPLPKDQIIGLIIADLISPLMRKILGTKPVHEG